MDMQYISYMEGYNDALEELLQIAEDIDDTYMIEVIKEKLNIYFGRHGKG